ncbi:MAG: CinA family protein [Rickettsiales bacterium]
MMSKLAKELVTKAKANNLKIATAESCTGGIVSSAITSISGSSEVFDRGFVTYSYESKTDILGVDAKVISSKGAVSKEVAAKMAQGALANSNADLSVAITGIAGPLGGTPSKPVGLVWFATARGSEIKTYQFNFTGTRSKIREKASIKALELLLKIIN